MPASAGTGGPCRHFSGHARQFLRCPGYHAGRQRSAEHAGLYLRECGVTTCGSIIAKWREAAIVRGSQLIEGDIFGRFKNLIPDFFRALYPRINGVCDTDKNTLVRFHMSSYDLQHARAILLAGKSDVKIPRLQMEE